MTADILVTILVALLSGTGGWGTLQLIINRRGAKAEAARIEADREVKQQEARKTEAERLALIADMERKAYDKGLEAADRRYAELHQDYDNCRAGLDKLREATESLIEAIEAIMTQAPATHGTDIQVTISRDHVATVRAAMRSARSHLN